MAIYFDSRYTSDMRLAVKEELLAVAEQTANSAKAAERERCAKIAEAIIEDCLKSPGYRPELYDESLMVEKIAAKIRSGE